MPTEIASLYASIGADTSGLNKGLQQASGALGAAEKDMLKAGAAAGATAKGIDGLGNAFQAAGARYDKTTAAANRLNLITLQLAEAQKKLATEMDPMRAAQLRVEIDNLMRSQDSLQREVNESKDALAGMKDADAGFKVMGLSLTDLRSGLSMVMGAAQKAGQALRGMFDATQEGAAIRQTTQSFERLGLSIDSLRGASLGTVDDMTLMRASLTLTAGASAELQKHMLANAPQLMQIAKAANALNPTLGDTAYMYESINTGIKRNSPLILDNLGIVVKIGEANAKYAAQLGKTVEELTAEEQSIALLNATIEAGDRLIQQAGGSVESYTDSWARLRVEVKNSTDELKENAAIIAGPVVGRYADFIKATRENEQSLIGFGAAARFTAMMLGMDADAATRTGGIIDWLTGNYMAAGDAAELLAAESGDLSQKTEQVGNAAKTASDKQAYLNKELERELVLLNAMKNSQETHRELISKVGTTMLTSLDAWKQYERAQRQVAAAADAAAYAAANQRKELQLAAEAADRNARANLIIAAVNSTFTEDLDEQTLTLDELRQKQADTRAEIDKLNASQGRAVTVWSKATLTEAEAALATLQLADAQAKLAAETDPLKAAQLAVKVEDLQGKLGGASTATTTFIDNTKKVSELEGVYDDLQEEIDAVTAATYASVNAFMFQQMVSRMAADGWSDAELAMLDVLGQAAGIDTTFIKLAPLLDDAAAGVADIGTEAEVGASKGKQLAGIAADIAFRATEAGEAWSLVGAAYEAGGIHGAKVSRELRDDAVNLTDQFINMGNAGEWGFTAIEGAGRSSEIAMADIPPKITAIGDAAEELEPRFVDFAAAAGENLGAVEGAARSSAGGLTLIGNQALWAQEQIDKMHGKEIDVLFIYRDEDRRKGAGAGATSIGNPFDTTIPHEQNASGGWLNTGSASLVGERGPEMIYATSAGVQIEPLSGAGAGDGAALLGATWTGDIVIQGVSDPEAAANAVIRKLADRGIVRAGGYR